MKKLESVNEINALVERGEIDYLLMLCEAYQDRCIVDFVNAVEEKNKRVILLAGPSSSGKTTSSKKICLHLDAVEEEPLYLGTDDYFIDRANIPFDENGKQNFDNLDALDIELFGNQLTDLLAGRIVDLPSYNFVTGVKEFGKRKVRLNSDQRIVIEGIHALNDLMTPTIGQKEKFKIFVCPRPSFHLNDGSLVNGEDVRKIRRTVRDFNKRAWSVESTFEMWDSVVEGERKFIFPFEKNADAFFNTSLPYELCAIKKHIVPLLTAVKENSKHYEEAQRLLNIVNQFASLDDESKIEGDSIIREFIGGSTIG